MEAQTLNCPNCGAAISSDSPQCQYCESKLATIACPSCFAMMFIGSKHCPRCGAAAAQATAAELSVLKCPRCKTKLSSITLGTTAMRNATGVRGCGLRSERLKRFAPIANNNPPYLGRLRRRPRIKCHQATRIRFVTCLARSAAS